jgi:CRISPR-associated protein Cmr4
LVLLPIRSVRGTFAWVTSPHLLRRLRRDAQEAGLAWRFPADKPADSGALVAGDRLIVKIAGREQVVLEDFDFVPKKSNEVAGLAEDLGKALYGDDKDAILHLRERLCVVSDDVMRVLVRTGMEVTARNRIDGDTRTVAKGALWTEEALPAESVLSGMLVVTPVRATDTADELLKHVRSLCRGTVQLGGKASVGRGLCAVEVL